MTRRVFFSFHHANDAWRAAQVRNIGGIDGNRPANDNEWEDVKKRGDAGIRQWIDAQMHGKSAVVVLIGEKTAERRWVHYEIKKAWQERKGLLGVYVNDLKNQNGDTAQQGRNPFSDYMVADGKLTARKPLSVFTSSGVPLEDIALTYETPFWAFSSRDVYENIRGNLADWIDVAIDIRHNYDYENSVF